MGHSRRKNAASIGRAPLLGEKPMPEDKQIQATALSQSNKGFWIVLVILILLIGFALFWWFGKNNASMYSAKALTDGDTRAASNANQGLSDTPAAANTRTGTDPGAGADRTNTAGTAPGEPKGEQVATLSQKIETTSGEKDKKTAGKAAVDAKKEQTGAFAQLPATRPSETVLDVKSVEKDKKAAALMEKRKVKFGVEEKMDLIARSDETVRIGEFTVPLDKIRQQIQAEEKGARTIVAGDGVVSPSQNKAEAQKAGMVPFPPLKDENDKEISLFGIYIVKPGDNVWNIHFGLLQHFFDKKGVRLPPFSDEPLDDGNSSGVGRVLKFSEKMVHIYNLLEGRLDDNLDMIRPLTKIVVYNMEHLFELFDKVNPDILDRVQYDGQTLWLPKG